MQIEYILMEYSQYILDIVITNIFIGLLMDQLFEKKHSFFLFFVYIILCQLFPNLFLVIYAPIYGRTSLHYMIINALIQVITFLILELLLQYIFQDKFIKIALTETIVEGVSATLIYLPLYFFVFTSDEEVNTIMLAPVNKMGMCGLAVSIGLFLVLYIGLFPLLKKYRKYQIVYPSRWWVLFVVFCLINFHHHVLNILMLGSEHLSLMCGSASMIMAVAIPAFLVLFRIYSERVIEKHNFYLKKQNMLEYHYIKVQEQILQMEQYHKELSEQMQVIASLEEELKAEEIPQRKEKEQSERNTEKWKINPQLEEKAKIDRGGVRGMREQNQKDIVSEKAGEEKEEENNISAEKIKQKIEKYIMEMKQQYQKIVVITYCNDFLINTTLCYYADLCKKEGIQTDFLLQEYRQGQMEENEFLRLICILLEEGLKKARQGKNRSYVIYLHVASVTNQMILVFSVKGNAETPGEFEKNSNEKEKEKFLKETEKWKKQCRYGWWRQKTRKFWIKKELAYWLRTYNGTLDIVNLANPEEIEFHLGLEMKVDDNTISVHKNKS